MRRVAGVIFAFCLFCVVPCVPQSDSAPQSEQVRLSEILIKTPQPYDPFQMAEAKRKAEELREAIQQGAYFASVARTSSQGATASQGGDLGCFIHGKLSGSLDALVFHMNVGEVSDVIRTKQGFVILQVTRRGEDACADIAWVNPNVPPDLKPYLDMLWEEVRKRWYKTLRPVSPAFRNKQGTTTIEFVLRQDGNITDEKVAWSSGDPDLDAAALNAVKHAGRLPAFPYTVKTDRVRLRFRFDYNKVAN